MKRFAALYKSLDETTKTNRKVRLLRDYLSESQPEDAAWAVYFLSGRKPQRLLRARDLAEWASEIAQIPEWLFEECRESVGDLAETIALLLPPASEANTETLAQWIEHRLLPLRLQSLEQQKQGLLGAWKQLTELERLVWNKLITGSFRVGVSQTLVIRALAEVASLPADVVAHRLMGTWEPTADFYRQLIGPDTGDTQSTRPYPFSLAHALTDPLESLGDPRQWFGEWKWDGIRAQLIRRDHQLSLWSRGEEVITDRFPELHDEAYGLPDGTVLDGEVVAWRDDQVLPFADLQRRIGRKSVGKKLLQDVPVRYVVFDILEFAHQDLRQLPFHARRQKLETCLNNLQQPESFQSKPIDTLFPLDDPDPLRRIIPAELFRFEDWENARILRLSSRDKQVEGLMLKSAESTYGVGRLTGQWWKWKVEPYVIDAVLIYAQRGHGRRASLYTDYTFAVWDQGELVPFAKAYSGLTDAEIRKVDAFVRQHTIEKFGPMRRVTPQLVFELAFENIQASPRHKSGIAVRFPRMNRWRTDKRPEDADTLDNLRNLLQAHNV